MQTVEVPASATTVFDLVHDYKRRLEWDTMLSQAMLLGGATLANVGVRSLCVGTWRSGFVAMETEYVTFARGRVAAVKLTNRPSLFERFAATIKHQALTETRSRITYIYSFSTRPRILAPMLDPIVDLIMARAIRGRLLALQLFFAESGHKMPAEMERM